MTRSVGRGQLLRLGAACETRVRKHHRLLAAARTVKYDLRRRRYRVRCQVKSLIGHYRALPLASFLKKPLAACGALIYEKRTLVAMCLSPPVEGTLPPNMEVRNGTLADFNRLTEMRRGFRDPVSLRAFFTRVREGMQYYIACIDGNPVASAWIRLGGEYAPSELYGELTLTADSAEDAFVLDVWTQPRMRGKALYPHLVREIASRLFGQGACQRMRAAVDVRNLAARRADRRAGFIPIEHLQVVRLFGRTVTKQSQPTHGLE